MVFLLVVKRNNCREPHKVEVRVLEVQENSARAMGKLFEVLRKPISENFGKTEVVHEYLLN